MRLAPLSQRGGSIILRGHPRILVETPIELREVGDAHVLGDFVDGLLGVAEHADRVAHAFLVDELLERARRFAFDIGAQVGRVVAEFVGKGAQAPLSVVLRHILVYASHELRIFFDALLRGDVELVRPDEMGDEGGAEVGEHPLLNLATRAGVSVVREA